MSERGTDDTAEMPQPTLFSRIIAGELPGRFVWRDDEKVAFLTIAPIQPGHVLVVPVEPIDHWLDVPAGLWADMNELARRIGEAQMAAFSPNRIGLIVAGLEVPHCHLHVIPIETEADLNFAHADQGASAEALDAAAQAIRQHLPGAAAA
ncbi:MAG: HIT family protein [Microthrixaceae bacterium]|nr:HIT family protein [Microthrixaceae bacterium]